MTDTELTKAAVSIYRKACDDLGKLIKAQGVPIYRSAYALRRQFRHNDDSGIVTSGKDLLSEIATKRVTAAPGSTLAQATPSAVARLKNKIVKDIVSECRCSISAAEASIIKNESRIRELVKSGKISEKQLSRLLAKEKQ